MDMPLTTQALYFHLNLRADDDGFVGNPKMITRNIGASMDDLKLLITKRFVLLFEDGVIVIKHWRLHNNLTSSRYTETKYLEDKARLFLKDNGSYSENEGNLIDDTHYIEIGKRQTIQRRDIDETKTTIDKNRLDKNSKEKSTKFVPPTLEEVQEYCRTRGNKVNAEQFIDYYAARGWKLKSGTMKDWKAAVRTWERNGYDDRPAKKETKFNSFEQRDYNYSDLERKLLGG